MKKPVNWHTIFCLLVAISSLPVNGQSLAGSASNQYAVPIASSKPQSSRPHKKQKPGEQPPNGTSPQNSAKREASESPSDAEIAAARSGGKVWVNLESGIYHKAGRWYGKTKNGKFMSEAEAKAAGYKASQRN